MSAVDLFEIARLATWILVKMAAPVMLVGLGVGIVVALLQALTQIQEMTLVFVPKILAMFIAFIIFLPFMSDTIAGFFGQLMQIIATTNINNFTN